MIIANKLRNFVSFFPFLFPPPRRKENLFCPKQSIAKTSIRKENMKNEHEPLSLNYKKRKQKPKYWCNKNLLQIKNNDFYVVMIQIVICCNKRTNTHTNTHIHVKNALKWFTFIDHLDLLTLLETAIRSARDYHG